MAKKYLEQLSSLLKQVELDQFSHVEIKCNHFFSGAAAWVNGNMFLSFTPVGLALKLPLSARQALLRRAGARELRYFPSSPIKKDYVLLPERMRKERQTLRYWIALSIEYVCTLSDTPPPKKRTRGCRSTAESPP